MQIDGAATASNRDIFLVHKTPSLITRTLIREGIDDHHRVEFSSHLL